MNFKRILTLSFLLIAAYSFAYAGQPTTSNAAPDNTEDYCDHAEFRRVSTVRASQVIFISV